MGKSKAIGQLRRLIERAAGEPIYLTPGQVELALKLGYEFEQEPALESTLLTPRAFDPIIEPGPFTPLDEVQRLTEPLTLTEAHVRWRRAEEHGSALERGGQ